jgi:hypothetical protein
MGNVALVFRETIEVTPVDSDVMLQSAVPGVTEIQMWPVDRLIAYASNARKNDAAIHRMAFRSSGVVGG